MTTARLIWWDETPSSRGIGKDNSEVWRTKCGSLNLCVVKGHVLYPSSWFGTCQDVDINMEMLLVASTREEACQELLNLVCRKVGVWSTALEADNHKAVKAPTESELKIACALLRDVVEDCWLFHRELGGQLSSQKTESLNGLKRPMRKALEAADSVLGPRNQ